MITEIISGLWIGDHEDTYNEDFINDNLISSCLAADDGAALHFKDGEFSTVVSFYKGAGAYKVSLKNGIINHEKLNNINIY